MKKRLLSGGFPYMSIINVEGYQCKKCKLVILGYGEAGNPAEGSP
jgi:hypothetical protein